jgi:hypothetical protein
MDWLKTKVEELKLGKDMQTAMADLMLVGSEQDLRAKKLELEHKRVDMQIRQQEELEDARLQNERLRIEFESAQLKAKMKALKSPATPAEVAPDQKRAYDRTKCEERISYLKAEKEKAQKIPDEDERLHKVNAIDDVLQREFERWSKLL